MARIKRIVSLSNDQVARCKLSNRTQLWAFGVADFAKALGEQEETVRRKINCGTYDPSTLEGVTEMLRGQV